MERNYGYGIKRVIYICLHHHSAAYAKSVCLHLNNVIIVLRVYVREHKYTHTYLHMYL
jgi:hypothetical protein